jgi:hypothetical protein
MLRRLLISIVVLSAAALAHPSVSIVIDSKGNVFYSDLEQVWRLDPQGNKTVAVAKVHTHELWLDSSDALYGEHLWYTGPQDGSGKWFHRIWKRTADGRISDVVPAREGFRTDFSFVRDAAGNGYMAADGVEAAPKFVRLIDVSGHSRVLAGGSSGQRDGKGDAAGFANIRWMCVGQDGNLYLVDDGSVRRVTRDGVVTTLARNVSEHSRLNVTVDHRHDLMGLTADAAGNVYVAVYGARQIKKIGADGNVTVFDRSTLPWSPTGIALSGKTAFVLEYADPLAVRVRRLTMK